MSHSCRSLLRLKSLIKEVIDNFGVYSENLKFMSRSTIYERKKRAMFVATSPRINPRSKHIAVKYHCFRQHVEKEFIIWKIKSENQKVDIFTKGLKRQIFVQIRKLLCVW